MDWLKQLKGNSLEWLLTSDVAGVRYLALRHLLDRPPADAQLRQARAAAHREGPIPAILAKMEPEGYWVRPGAGYNPKYRSAAWSVLLLAQLGASALEDERIGRACAYMLDHSLCSGGQFTTSGAPSGTIDCLQGNLCWALLELGCDDPRLKTAFEWMARTITGEDVAGADETAAPRRYYAYKCGPDFACGVNGDKPCAWGAAKEMLALGRLPEDWRTPLVKRAIRRGVEFLFSVELTGADWPTRTDSAPNRSWWKFGFPVFYVTDLLQIAEALVGLGYGRDKRLRPLLALIAEKQDEEGRWQLDYDYSGKTWVDFGDQHQPNPWVTLRALRVLKAAAA